ncbi:glycine, alanine and asparagine-rich protein-like [Cyclospora cayetanensis]|uniref:Palmitoyltransferase n=1 Tax=Cyclospora cayetanensis TaxID=88456 RepID=A0A6P6RVI8_9EIME|nr:glycine, alanine and asparagine-rich protein-like [Cyclospora cayetanensis]
MPLSAHWERCVTPIEAADERRCRLPAHTGGPPPSRGTVAATAFSPYCRMDSANGSTYVAHEDEGGSQSLPSPDVEWPDGDATAAAVAAAAVAVAAAAAPFAAGEAPAAVAAAPPALEGASAAAEGTWGGGLMQGAAGTAAGATAPSDIPTERRRHHRSGRAGGNARSGRNVRVGATSAVLAGVSTAGDSRRRFDGRTSASFRRGGKPRRRAHKKGRDARRQQQLQQQQPQPLRLTSEVLMQLEARTSSRVHECVHVGVVQGVCVWLVVCLLACAVVESGLGVSGEEALAPSGGSARGSRSLSFFWLVKHRAEQNREAAGDARRQAAFQRAEAACRDSAAGAAGEPAPVEVDECSSQSQRSSEVSTKGTVNHKCREDDVRINLCENPSDLWYGLKMQDGRPVIVHSRAVSSRPSWAAGAAAVLAAIAAAAARAAPTAAAAAAAHAAVAAAAATAAAPLAAGAAAAAAAAAPAGPWINNCVGFLNQKYFLLFLVYVNLMCCTAFVVLVCRVVTCVDTAAAEGFEGTAWTADQSSILPEGMPSSVAEYGDAIQETAKYRAEPYAEQLSAEASNRRWRIPQSSHASRELPEEAVEAVAAGWVAAAGGQSFCWYTADSLPSNTEPFAWILLSCYMPQCDVTLQSAVFGAVSSWSGSTLGTSRAALCRRLGARAYCWNCMRLRP